MCRVADKGSETYVTAFACHVALAYAMQLGAPQPRRDAHAFLPSTRQSIVVRAGQSRVRHAFDARGLTLVVRW